MRLPPSCHTPILGVPRTLSRILSPAIRQLFPPWSRRCRGGAACSRIGVERRQRANRHRYASREDDVAAAKSNSIVQDRTMARHCR
jgi:hypothetical protein